MSLPKVNLMRLWCPAFWGISSVRCFTVLSTSQCWPTLRRHFDDIVQAFAAYPYILFTTLTLLTFQYMLTKNESTLCVHCVSLFYKVDIAMLIDIGSTSCLHRTSYILFTSTTLSILQCLSTLSRHCVVIVCLLSSFHNRYRRYRNVDRHRVDIGSTLNLFIAHDVNNKEISAI